MGWNAPSLSTHRVRVPPGQPVWNRQSWVGAYRAVWFS